MRFGADVRCNTKSYGGVRIDVFDNPTVRCCVVSLKRLNHTVQFGSVKPHREKNKKMLGFARLGAIAD